MDAQWKKVFRDARGHLSQGQTAAILHCPVRTIQFWEQGLRTPPPWVQRLLLKELKSFHEKSIKQKNRSIEVTINSELYDRVAALAAKQRLTIDDLACMALKLLVKEHASRKESPQDK